MALIEFEDREPGLPLSWLARVLIAAFCLLGAIGMWSAIWGLFSLARHLITSRG